MNTITINFIPCNPAPAQGYKLTWRVAGSGDPYTDEGFFTESPIVFTDNLNPEGTCYEGFLQSDCSESGESGTVVGAQIPWATVCEESGVNYTIELIDPCIGSPTANYLISGGTPGDTVTVRIQFTGLLQKISGDFTRADVSIFSPNGTPGSQSSACYSDTGSHGFSVTADTVITMASDTEVVTATAVVHNSSDGPTGASLTIIEVNGVPVSISVNGCKGDSSTGGTC
jgi:hypothetical protein